MGTKNTKYDVFKYIDMSGGEDACWPWTRGTGGGTGKSKPRPYFQVDGQKLIVYRLVWELVYGVTLSPDEFLCHQCDNSICCNPKHLRIGTHEENMQEMNERDRHGLTHVTVRRIRYMLAVGDLTHQEIADLNETSRATVGRIARNELHTLPEDYPDYASKDSCANDLT